MTKAKADPYTAAEDRGCVFWPKCSTCVFAKCVKEMGPRERGELTQALKVVKTYLAAPDGTLTP